MSMTQASYTHRLAPLNFCKRKREKDRQRERERERGQSGEDEKSGEKRRKEKRDDVAPCATQTKSCGVSRRVAEGAC